MFTARKEDQTPHLSNIPHTSLISSMKSMGLENQRSEHDAGFQGKLQRERAWISSLSESQSFVEDVYP